MANQAIGVAINNFEVKLFVKLVLVVAFFAAILSVNLNAQTPAPAGASNPPAATIDQNSAAPAQSPEKKEAVVPPAAPAVFHVLGLPVTNSMICTWIVAAIILIVVRSTTSRNIKEVPSGMQNVIESLVELWDGLIGDILDKRVTRWVFPFATTFFIFILISNLMDLVPGWEASVLSRRTSPRSRRCFARRRRMQT